MTCVAVEHHEYLSEPRPAEVARAAIFWGFILLVIVSPAVLGALILASV